MLDIPEKVHESIAALQSARQEPSELWIEIGRHASKRHSYSRQSWSRQSVSFVLTLVTRGHSFDGFREYVSASENASYFIGFLHDNKHTWLYAVQYLGTRSVTNLKTVNENSAIFNQLIEKLDPDCVLRNVQDVSEITREVIMQSRGSRSSKLGRKQSLFPRTELQKDFLTYDDQMLHAWSQIRHNQYTKDSPTWMVLAYVDDSIDAPPMLHRCGVGGISAFAAGGELSTVSFKEGHLYWIYARVEVESITGTGTFNAASGSFGDGQAFSPGSSKFVLISLNLSSSTTGYQASSRLMIHKGTIASILVHHCYVEAHSLDDISEDKIVPRLLNNHVGEQLILMLSIQQNQSPFAPPVMMRINPRASIHILKQRVAKAYRVSVNDVQLFQEQLQTTQDIINILKSTVFKNLTESQLEKQLKSQQKNSLVELNGDEHVLTDMGLVSGDKILVRIMSVQESFEEDEIQVNFIKTRAVENFLEVRAKREAFRKTLYSSFLNLKSTEQSPELLPKRKSDTRKSVSSRLLSIVRSRSGSHPVSTSPSSNLKVTTSNLYLQHLYETALNLGARLVHPEDLIILEETLGDGKTARVREGLLLGQVDDDDDSMAIQVDREVLQKAKKKSFAPWKQQKETESDDKFMNCRALKVAVKMFSAKFVTKQVHDAFMEEIQVLAKLNHESIVRILGVFIDTEIHRKESDGFFLFIIYELMERGSLSQLRQSTEWVDIPLVMKVKMALDVARGVEYIHNQEVVHRDLKSANLLLDQSLRLKIGDFGISISHQEGLERFETVGTSGWVAPEVAKGQGYHFSSDIFSVSMDIGFLTLN